MNEDKKKSDPFVSFMAFVLSVGAVGWCAVFTIAPFVILKFLFKVW